LLPSTRDGVFGDKKAAWPLTIGLGFGVTWNPKLFLPLLNTPFEATAAGSGGIFTFFIAVPDPCLFVLLFSPLRVSPATSATPGDTSSSSTSSSSDGGA
jgi:hypothetical protein